jgi:sugar phosphate permease
MTRRATAIRSPRAAPQESRPAHGVYRWELLALLWFAFFLHQGDKQIFNSVVSSIQVDLGLSKFQIGLVGTIFTFVYGLLVPVAGLAGDRFPRKAIIVLSLLIFSLGTLLTGFSTGLVSFIVFLSLTTGGGEAWFYPSATSLLAQLHDKTRAMALGILQTALYVGITASGLIAGYLGERYGWQSPFWVFGGAGLAWTAVVAWRMRNTPMERTGPALARVPLGEVLAYVLRRRSVWLLSLALASMVAVDVGYRAWTPTMLHEKFHLSQAEAGLNSMLFHYLFAFVGVLAGGKIADRLAAIRPSIRMEANFVGLLCGAPFIFWLGRAETPSTCYAALALFGLFRGIYDSNLVASLFDVIEPRMRASATGLMFSFAFVVGSLSPAVLGWLEPRVGLSAGLSSLCCCYLFGAACVLAAILFFFKRDFVRHEPQP